MLLECGVNRECGVERVYDVAQTAHHISTGHHRARQTPHQYLFGLQHLVNEHDHVDQAEVLFKEGGRNETRAR